MSSGGARSMPNAHFQILELGQLQCQEGCTGAVDVLFPQPCGLAGGSHDGVMSILGTISKLNRVSAALLFVCGLKDVSASGGYALGSSGEYQQSPGGRLKQRAASGGGH